MDSELALVNKTVKRFDRDLFAKRDGGGVVRVYCNQTKYTVYSLEEGVNLFVPHNEPYHVFSLTDTWGYWGNPVRYGLLPLSEKLRHISWENRENLFAELEESEREAQEAKKRGLANLTGDMAREARDVFKDATKDVVFSNIDKKKDIRRKYEKRIKQEI